MLREVLGEGIAATGRPARELKSRNSDLPTAAARETAVKGPCRPTTESGHCNSGVVGPASLLAEAPVGPERILARAHPGAAGGDATTARTLMAEAALTRRQGQAPVCSGVPALGAQHRPRSGVLILGSRRASPNESGHACAPSKCALDPRGERPRRRGYIARCDMLHLQP